MIPIPKVSVLMITYNHEPFVAQAIESVLAQQTRFPIEIVLGEDCSTDRTREIVARFQAQHPDRLRVLLPERNLGVNRNFIETLRACRGEYVAMLEGDDYWLSTCKLQRQVDYLDAHPEFSLCAHEAYDEAPDGGRRFYVRLSGVQIREHYALEDVLRRHFLPTASMVFRRQLVLNPPRELAEIPGVDWLLHTILAQQGAIAFIDEVWSVRRVHAGGLTSLMPTPSKIRHTIRTAAIIDGYLKGAYAHLLRPTIVAGVVDLVADAAFTDPARESLPRKLERGVDPWQREYLLSPAERAHVLERALAHLLILHYLRKNLAQVRACWWRALLTANGTALKDRRFWSIGLSLLLGPALADAVRNLARRMVGGGR